jgi:hypothetical protein
MRRKLTVYCEACGGETPRGENFVIFHCLGFCSPDCRDDYRAVHEARRGQNGKQNHKRRKAA